MITFKEATKIVDSSDVFFRSDIKVSDYDVSIFNYLLAGYNDFKKTSFEIRGLSFVHKEDGSCDRWLMLPKFFNVGEIEENSIQNLKQKKISHIFEKMDGSLVQPILLPNGEIKFKTKMSFSNQQAESSNKVAKNSGLLEKIRPLLEQGYNLLFEYTSPLNQIVVEYQNHELTLLAVRDKNGKFLNLKEVANSINAKTPEEFENKDLDYYIEKKKTVDNFEGWIIWFEDGHIAKLKTDWYIKLHGTIGNIQYSKISQLALNDELDDIKLFASGEKLKFINSIEHTVFSKFNHYVKTIKKYSDILGNMERKDFVLKYKEELGKMFGLVMRVGANAGYDAIQKETKNHFSKIFIKEQRTINFLDICD